MKISIKLNKSNGDRGNGYELVLYASHLQKRRQKVIAYSKIEHFNEDMQLVNDKHPDYDVLMPRLMDIKLKIRKVLASGIVDVDGAVAEIINSKAEDYSPSYSEWCESYVKELEHLAAMADKRGDLIARNRFKGNANANKNAYNQFNQYFQNITFSQLDYNMLMRFRKQRELLGNSKMTVLNYLRQLASMYNKGIRELNLPDNRPFYKTTDGLKQKSYDVKKKYIDISSVKQLEDFKPNNPDHQKFIDLFLLQFYFGGCDLTDLYFLKKTFYRSGRVIIERGKTGQMASLKVHDKAKVILDKYITADNEYVFPWSKEFTYYETWRRLFQHYLMKFQKQLNIQVLPMGGNLAVKVARHTFGNRAKQLMVDTDIIRELMAHERNDVDNFYKDKFSEKVRDEALFKIIDTDSI